MKDTLAKVMDAAVFAAIKHQYLRRGGYDQLPYINHLLKVAEALIRIAGKRDDHLLMAAVLHDIIEDTDTTEKELSQRFGPETASIVVELTDDMTLPYEERKRRQVETAKSLSHKAKLIRLVDKASNIRDIFSYPVDWPWEKKVAYVDNAAEIYEAIKGEDKKVDAWTAETIQWARDIISKTEEAT